MAERPEEPEAGTAQPLDQASPASVAIALGRTSKGGKALDAEAATFLREQTDLIRLQKEHLHEQRELQTSRLRWGRFSDRMKAVLQVMTAILGLAVATVVGAMAWSASQDHGLVIEAFSVPPDLAQRGLSGQVIASQVLDRLADMQAKTFSSRPAGSYQNDWGQDIKVEIPETGVSASELYRYLRQWLGDETHITGEVYRTADGIAITARAGALPGATAKGTEADLDKLVQQAAEAVYGQTQPYRYAAYLNSVGRSQEAVAAFDRLAQSGPAEERGWAYLALAGGQYDPEARASYARLAIALAPQLEQACSMLATSQQRFGGLGHEEAALQQWRKCVDLARSGHAIDFPTGDANSAGRLRFLQATLDQSIGDYQAAAEEIPGGLGRVEGQGSFPALPYRILALAWDHDVSGSRRWMADLNGSPPRAFALSPAFARASQAEALDDWTTVAAELEAEQPRQLALGAPATTALVRALQPLLAYAYARTGRVSQAEALVGGTPMDCDFCDLARGEVAAAGQDWSTANRWFSLVARRTPSIPFANTEWGEMLLAKGDTDGAIARLADAHRQSPHFADPLELWGEALMRKGDAKGAARKFASADKCARRWGRDHLRWGQALAKLGKPDEARAQWRAAAGMDLSVADRAELARMQGAAA